MGKYTTLVRGVREEEKSSKALYYYVFKHSIIIDSSVASLNPHLIGATPLRGYAVDAVAAEHEETARTTYDTSTGLRGYGENGITLAPAEGVTTYDINDITTREAVARLFMDQPGWLRRQLDAYHSGETTPTRRGGKDYTLRVTKKTIASAVRLHIAFDMYPETVEEDPSSNRLKGSPVSALSRLGVPSLDDVALEVGRWLR